MQITDKMLRENVEQAREDWLNSLPQRDQIPEASVSQQFEERMNDLLQRQRRAENIRRIMSTVRRTAVVILLVIAISFAGLMTVDAFREKVLHVVAYIFQDHTLYDYRSDRSDATLPDIQFPSLPAGLEKASDDIINDRNRLIHFESTTGLYLDLDIHVISQDTTLSQVVDTEGAEVSYCTLGGRELTIVSKNGRYNVFWAEENTIISIGSNLPLSDLKTIISKIIIH